MSCGAKQSQGFQDKGKATGQLTTEDGVDTRLGLDLTPRDGQPLCEQLIVRDGASCLQLFLYGVPSREGGIPIRLGTVSSCPLFDQGEASCDVDSGICSWPEESNDCDQTKFNAFLGKPSVGHVLFGAVAHSDGNVFWNSYSLPVGPPP